MGFTPFKDMTPAEQAVWDRITAAGRRHDDGDPSEDAAERLADAMGDATHPMHEEHYEAEEEAFTRRHERENQAKPAPVDFDGPARPDPVGPGQTLLRRLDAERQADHERGMERERVRYRRGLDDPRYG